MPGIFQGDIIIKAAIDRGIDDMRKNSWLIDHMLEDLVNDPYLKEKYGQKQIDACKEWLANNQIDVYMRPREDRDRLPCITISMGPSEEKPDMRHMGDLSPWKKILYPNQIGKPIPYVIKPFTPINYDSNTGEVQVPDEIDLSTVAAGMILVNPANGTGYVILGLSPSGILIEPDQEISATQFGIIPKFQYYEARVEHSYFQDTYHIACHAHGDPQVILWLWSIMTYALLRYRQGLLEANGFTESTFHSAPPELNEQWTTDGGEKAFTRAISLTGQVQNTWIKAPHRFIETVSLKDPSCDGYTGGIKILSNLNTPPIIDTSDQNWVTIEDDDE